MVYVAWGLAIAIVIAIVWWFGDGLLEGYTDHSHTRYDHDALVDYSMKFNSVKWAGWYIAYYGRKNFREWKAENNYTERRNERRKQIIERREDRRRSFLESRNG